MTIKDLSGVAQQLWDPTLSPLDTLLSVLWVGVHEAVKQVKQSNKLKQQVPSWSKEFAVTWESPFIQVELETSGENEGA